MITVLWHERDSAGYIDLLPDDWFLTEGSLRNCIHTIRGPRSGPHKAMCNVLVSGSRADLDYESFAEFNTKHGVYL